VLSVHSGVPNSLHELKDFRRVWIGSAVSSVCVCACACVCLSAAVGVLWVFRLVCYVACRRVFFLERALVLSSSVFLRVSSIPRLVSRASSRGGRTTSGGAFGARSRARRARSFHTSRYMRYNVRHGSCSQSRRYLIKRTRVTQGR